MTIGFLGEVILFFRIFPSFWICCNFIDKSVASVDAALMHRNASVPNFSTDHSTTRKQTHLTTDSFSQFLSDFDKSSSKNDVSDEKQPNYSRSFFEGQFLNYISHKTEKNTNWLRGLNEMRQTKSSFYLHN